MRLQWRSKQLLVSENGLVGKRGNDFGDRAHGRQDHDVDRRVGVDPEEMLIEKRIASFGRIKHSDPEHSFGDYQQQGDSDDRSGKQPGSMRFRTRTRQKAASGANPFQGRAACGL